MQAFVTWVFGLILGILGLSSPLPGADPPETATPSPPGEQASQPAEKTPRERLRERARERFFEAEGVRAIRDLVYAERAPGGPMRLDLYLPEAGPKDGERLPVVIWVHGGGWRAGSKNQCPAVPMVSRGFAVASVQYRFTNVAPMPAQIEDCKAAIRFLRARADEYGLDKDRFGAWGASAGGHLVALLGTAGDHAEWDFGPHADQSSRVQAVCNWFGPTDIERMTRTEGGQLALTPLIGDLPKSRPEKVKAASPVTYVSADDPPFLIMHGDQDRLVPVEQSRVLHEALRAAGVNSELVVIPGAGHGPLGESSGVKVMEFFERTLKPAPGAAPEVTRKPADPSR